MAYLFSPIHFQALYRWPELPIIASVEANVRLKDVIAYTNTCPLAAFKDLQVRKRCTCHWFNEYAQVHTNDPPIKTVHVE